MATPLPLLLVTPNAGVTLPNAANAASGLIAPSTEDAASDFATLMMQQLALIDPAAPAGAAGPIEANQKDLSSLSPAELAAAARSLGQGVDLKSVLAERNASASTDATTLQDVVAATRAATGGTTPVVVEAPTDSADQATVIVVNAPPPTLPDEAALTDAAGGEDDGVEAAEAALAAAIGAGVTPPQSDRLVQSAVLPTAVRSASSVRVLDQLLDHLVAAPVTEGAAKQPQPGNADNAATAAHTPAAARASASEVDMPRADVPGLVAQLQGSPRQKDSASARALSESGPVSLDKPIDPGMPLLPESAAAKAPPRDIPARVIADAAYPAISISAQATPTAAPAQAVLPVANDSLAQSLVDRGVADDPAASSEAISTDTITPGTKEPGASTSKAELAGLVRARVGESDTPSIRFSFEPPRPSAEVEVVTPTKTPSAAPTALVSLASSPILQGVVGTTDGAASGAAAVASLAVASAGVTSDDGAALSSDGDASDTLSSWQGFGSAAFADQGLGADLQTDGATGFGSMLPSASNGSTSAKGAFPAAPGHTVPPMLPPDQVAVHIAAAARDGARNLSIQLRPAALGRIDVELSVGRDGAVRARIQAERSETLDLLQRDAQGLERALDAAGLKAESGGLSFSLKDGGRQDRQPMPSAPSPALILADLPAEPAGLGRNAYRALAGEGRALDIQV